MTVRGRPALTWIGRVVFALLFLTELGVAVVTFIVGMFTGGEALFVQWSMLFGGLGLALMALLGVGLSVAGEVFRPLLIASTCLTAYCGALFIALTA